VTDLPAPTVGPLQRVAPRPLRLVLNWGRRYSLWVFNFGLACCAIEFIAASMARHDFIRLGVIPFRRMNYTPYPGATQRGFQDFLWMAETQQEWGQYALRMKQRMLWCASDAEEFTQAAATQIVFHECDAILQSVARKNMQRRGGEDAAAPEEREGGADAGGAV